MQSSISTCQLLRAEELTTVVSCVAITASAVIATVL